MKRVVFAVSALMLFVFITTVIMISGISLSESATVKIVSFNIRTALAREGVEWKYRSENVLSLIRDENPDILGMQEVTGQQYAYLRENLEEDYDWYGIYRSTPYTENSAVYESLGGFDEASPIFYKKTRYELVFSETFWLSETPDVLSRGWDADLNRICTHLTLRDKRTKEKVDIYNTHFDHSGDIARMESSKLIAEKVQSHTGKVMVMGDLNFEEGYEGYPLLAEVLQDAKHIAAVSDSGGTFQGFKSITKTPLPIDFIFVSNSFKVLQYRINRNYYGGSTPPSDHYPVSVIAE